MINEIWIINNGICLYHKVLQEFSNPKFQGLSLDKQLFSGFITALYNFSEDNSNYLQKISFNNGNFEIVHIEDILVVLSLASNLLSEKKLDQSIASLTNEIKYIIQTNEKLKHLRSNNLTKPTIVSLDEYKFIFEPFLNKVLEDMYLIQNQLIMVDILTLIQILEELKTLFNQVNVSSKIIEYSLTLSPKAAKVLKNIEILKDEDLGNLDVIQKEFKLVIQKSIKSIEKQELVNKNSNDIYKKLLSFVKKNYTILKQFQLEDCFFQEFIVLI